MKINKKNFKSLIEKMVIEENRKILVELNLSTYVSAYKKAEGGRKNLFIKQIDKEIKKYVKSVGGFTFKYSNKKPFHSDSMTFNGFDGYANDKPKILIQKDDGDSENLDYLQVSVNDREKFKKFANMLNTSGISNQYDVQNRYFFPPTEDDIISFKQSNVVSISRKYPLSAKNKSNFTGAMFKNDELYFIIDDEEHSVNSWLDTYAFVDANVAKEIIHKIRKFKFADNSKKNCYFVYDTSIPEMFISMKKLIADDSIDEVEIIDSKDDSNRHGYGKTLATKDHINNISKFNPEIINKIKQISGLDLTSLYEERIKASQNLETKVKNDTLEKKKTIKNYSKKLKEFLEKLSDKNVTFAQSNYGYRNTVDPNEAKSSKILGASVSIERDYFNVTLKLDSYYMTKMKFMFKSNAFSFDNKVHIEVDRKTAGMISNLIEKCFDIVMPSYKIPQYRKEIKKESKFNKLESYISKLTKSILEQESEEMTVKQAKKNIKGKKYADKESIFTAMSGKTSSEREKERNSMSALLDQRRKEKDPIKRKKIEDLINQKMGWKK